MSCFYLNEVQGLEMVFSVASMFHADIGLTTPGYMLLVYIYIYIYIYIMRGLIHLKLRKFFCLCAGCCDQLSMLQKQIFQSFQVC